VSCACGIICCLSYVPWSRCLVSSHSFPTRRSSDLGLVRAYGQATSAAVDRARIITRRQRVPVHALVDYAQANALERAAGNRGWITRADYGGEVGLDLLVPVAEVDEALATYADLTAGRAAPAVGEVEWV